MCKTIKPVKVAITGAAGQIGYALSFRVASGQMFGQDIPLSMRLLEIEPALPRLKGVGMELVDCAFPLLDELICTSDPDEAFADADWVLMVGSVPRQKGMERGDLLGINGKVFTAQGRALERAASPDAKVFVVGNPCNTNCLIAMHNAPKIPRENFFAMTALDENRARAQLAQRAGCPLSSIKRLVVWGNHSAKQFPDFVNCCIGDRLATEVISDRAWFNDTFVPLIQQRGAAVIEARGSSSAASAANAVIDAVMRLRETTQSNDFFSVSLASRGEYGIDPGLIFSFPSRSNGGKIEVVQGLKIDDYVQSQIDKVHNELRDEYRTVKQLGLIP